MIAIHFLLAVITPTAMACLNTYWYLAHGHNAISLVAAIFCGVMALPGILMQARGL